MVSKLLTSDLNMYIETLTKFYLPGERVKCKAVWIKGYTVRALYLNAHIGAFAPGACGFANKC